MNFKEFQNQSRLYVIGALEAEELEEFEKAREEIWEKGGRLHRRMLRVARSICAESASGEGFRRNQRPAHGDGAGTKRSVVARSGLSTAQVRAG